MNAGRLLLLVVLLGLGQLAHAQTCYEWRVGSCGANTFHSNYKTAAQEYVQAWPTCSPNVEGSATTNGVWDSRVDSYAFGTFPATTFQHKYKTTSNCLTTGCSTVESTATRTLGSRVNPEGCAECPPVGTQNFQEGSGPLSNAPTRMCFSGCSFKKDGVGLYAPDSNTWAQTYTSEGKPCASTAGTSGNDDGEDTDCDSTGMICKDKGDGEKNCGIYNGDRVCVQTVDPGKCAAYASGGAACKGENNGTEEPETPPAPNNGTPGTPAEPDAEITSTGGTTVYYYSPGTVAGSSTGGADTTPANSEGGNRPIGGDNDGDSGEGTGEGSECTGADCNASVPEFDDIGTVDEAFGQFWSDLNGVPLVAAASGLGASLGAGSCPDWSTSISVFGESWDVDFTSICTTWDSVAGVISAVMLVFFGFIAFRVLFSA